MARGSGTRSSILAAVVVALLLGLLLWWRSEPSRVDRSTAALTPPTNASLRAPADGAALPSARSVPLATSPAVSPTLAPAAGAPRPYQPRPMTEEMRERRRRVLAAPQAQTPVANPSAPAAAPTGMKDRTGKMGPEVKAMNQQLLPLVAQCFDQAKERGVRGNGMLALTVKLTGAEGIGRIIESVEPAPNNAIPDPELIDCVRQSAFTVDLPPPTEGGMSEGVLTIPFEGAPDAGAPTSH
jgi:hypothetical protein